MEIGLTHYLTVSALLFGFGLFCIVTRRNAIAMLLGIELILNAASLNFAAFNRFGGGGHLDGQIFSVFIIGLAAAEAAVAFAIVLAVFQQNRTIELDKIVQLRK